MNTYECEYMKYMKPQAKTRTKSFMSNLQTNYRLKLHVGVENRKRVAVKSHSNYVMNTLKDINFI